MEVHLNKRSAIKRWSAGFSCAAALLTIAPLQAQGVLVMGDSLSAGYGIDPSLGWVAIMNAKLAQQYPDWPVVNASVSGETTSGGLSRLPNLLAQHKPDFVLLELGANDGLRGSPLPLMKQNLEQMVTLSQDAGAQVIMIGNRLPPNYGPRYTQGFFNTYAQVANKFELPLVPFMLEGVALKPELMQQDGLHPKASAQQTIFDTIWSVAGDKLAPRD